MASRTIYEAPRIAGAPGEEVFTSTCAHNCGGRCVVNAHVKDGAIVRISSDPRKWTPELPPLTACVRGFGAAERVNHPDKSDRQHRRKQRVLDEVLPALVAQVIRSQRRTVVPTAAAIRQAIRFHRYEPFLRN